MSEIYPKKDAFRTAIRIVDAQRRAMVEADARTEVIQALEAVIKFLNRMPDHQVARLMGDDRAKPTNLRRDEAIKSAASMSLEDVDRMLSDESVTRLELEAVAIGRFHVPRGSMRSLGNLGILREKLRTFVQNERTHTTITELARNVR